MKVFPAGMRPPAVPVIHEASLVAQQRPPQRRKADSGAIHDLVDWRSGRPGR